MHDSVWVWFFIIFVEGWRRVSCKLWTKSIWNERQTISICVRIVSLFSCVARRVGRTFGHDEKCRFECNRHVHRVVVPQSRGKCLQFHGHGRCGALSAVGQRPRTVCDSEAGTVHLRRTWQCECTSSNAMIHSGCWWVFAFGIHCREAFRIGSFRNTRILSCERVMRTIWPKCEDGMASWCPWCNHFCMQMEARLLWCKWKTSTAYRKFAIETIWIGCVTKPVFQCHPIFLFAHLIQFYQILENRTE